MHGLRAPTNCDMNCAGSNTQNHSNGINLEIDSTSDSRKSILKSIGISGAVETYYIGINLKIAIEFMHCRKLLMVSILKSILNSDTVENYYWHQC